MHITIGTLAVISSYFGAYVATERVLQRPEKQARIAQTEANKLRAINNRAIALANRDIVKQRMAHADSIVARADSIALAQKVNHNHDQDQHPTAQDKIVFAFWCAKDWSFAKTNEERREALQGNGPMMSGYLGSCYMDIDGKIKWSIQE